MKNRFLQNLNIRKKLIVIFSMILISMGLLGAISYFNFNQIESKFIIVESAYDLSNIILEIRRYEKNYFLYSREDDLQETKRFITNAKEELQQLKPNIVDKEQQKVVASLNQAINAYESTLGRILPLLRDNEDSKDKVALVSDLRHKGQELVMLSQNLVDYERQLILKINKRLTNNFLLSAFLIILLFVFVIVFIIRKVVKPLKIIERTTKSIAEGEFKKVEIWQSNDEIQQIMIAFNKMVEELETRQDQLVQAQKLSSIGTLASGIAHQVNNPLNNISTSCQIMMEECEEISSELARKMMSNIESETFRARDIVRGLLEFSRNQEFIKTTNNLKEVVEKSVRLVSSQIPTGIEIIQQIPAGIELQLDRQRLQEVLINLLLNAVQAIAPDFGTISVIAVEDKENKRVELTVEDTGKGIRQEIRSRIFDPFFTTKDVGLGTGLGLYIVYGIVKRHHGTIEVDSLLSGGTKFTITLPLE